MKKNYINPQCDVIVAHSENILMGSNDKKKMSISINTSTKLTNQYL
ncbi:MAG: hypothetical protein MJZ64_01290 [Paludibacteraceae bacterium]|nr:hypothetical protein [Paludibacteraceae bacterium]